MKKAKQTFTMPEPIPGFDVLKWKQETQAKIYEKIKDMTTEERVAYFRKGSERAQKRRTEYRAKHGLD